MQPNLHFKRVACAVVLGLAVALTGCGGGGTQANNTINVVPSLGRFKQGTPVRILDSNGNVLKTGAIGSDGTVKLDIGSYAGVLIVEVQGGESSEYFDEATQSWVKFPQGKALRAVVPPGISVTAVTALTHAAAEQLLDALGSKLAAGKTATDVREMNTRLAIQFGLTDILAAPALIDDDNKVQLADGEAGKHALILAALPLAACSKTPSMTPCNVQAHQVAEALARDLKDGELDGKEDNSNIDNSITAIEIAGAFNNQAVVDFVKSGDGSFFQALGVSIEAKTPNLTDQQKNALASASTDVAQAKKFFADLRTGILPYTNPQQTGLLDKEGKKLQEETSELAFATLGGIDDAADILRWVAQLNEGQVPNNCTPTGPSTYHCWRYPVTIILTKSATNNWNWTIGALTGTVTITGDSTTMDGSLRPMSRDPAAAKARVLLTVSSSDLGNDVTRYALSGYMRDVAANDAGLLELSFAVGSYFDAHEPSNPNAYDPAKESAKFTGIFTTRNYRFTGEFDVGPMQSKLVDGSREVVGGRFVFKGNIDGTGLSNTDPNINFDLLTGELTLNVDGTNYNPAQPSSSSNYQTGSMVFTGTVHLSASDPGLKLVLQVAVTGWKNGTYGISYNDFNKLISITGSGSWDETQQGPTDVNLSNGQGISVVRTVDDDHAQVLKGSTKLAEIVGNRINYIDGTFASLF